LDVKRGTNFTVKIAPGGKECALPDLGTTQDEYLMCDENCINVVFFLTRGCSCACTTVSDNAFEFFLSSTNTARTTFCLPPEISVTYVYNLTITNSCGETIIKQIRFPRSYAPHRDANFTLVSDNFSATPDFPEAVIQA